VSFLFSRLEYNGLGVVTEHQFGKDVNEAFRAVNDKNLHSLLGTGTKTGLLPNTDAMVFIHDHDNQRGQGPDAASVITYKDPKLFIMATAFMLAYPYGIPRLMSSYEFEDAEQGPPVDKRDNILSPQMSCEGACTNGWVCEHRYPAIKKMVRFRQVVHGTKVNNWSDDGVGQMTFSRGARGFIAFNAEVGVPLNATVNTGLPPGIYCDIITGQQEDYECTGAQVEVDEAGKANIVLSHDDPNGVLAIHVEERIED
jgi:alpha-amylase